MGVLCLLTNLDPTRASLEETYRRFFPVVRERCRRLLGDGEEANDVAQETFIRLWRSGEAKLPPRQAAAWIHRTSVHLALDRLRLRKRRRQAGAPEPIALGASPVEILQSRRSLEVLIEHLPSDVLEAAILYRVDGLEQTEIAGLMNCSERTVRRLLEKLDDRLARLRSEMLS